MILTSNVIIKVNVKNAKKLANDGYLDLNLGDTIEIDVITYQLDHTLK